MSNPCRWRESSTDFGKRSSARGWLLLVALGLLYGCPTTMLDSLIFLPSAHDERPSRGVAERFFVARDGTRLSAWVAAPEPQGPWLLWSHGNAGNVANRVDILLALAAEGANVFAYDYRGYGRSEGRPSEAGVGLDAEAAYDTLLADGVPPERIVCLGESLGGAVTVALASVRPCAGVVLAATFTRLADVVRYLYGPFGWVVGDRFDSLARIGSLRGPLLAIHGDQDEIISFALGERLFAAAPEPKRFLRVAGAHHNDLFDAPGVVPEIVRFAREVTRSQDAARR